MNTNSGPPGLASSALGVRRGLAIEWGCGLYLPDGRLVITKEDNGSHLAWAPSGGAMLGTFSMKIDTFFETKQKSLEEISEPAKKLDIDRNEISSIRLKKPGNFLNGFVEFKLQSGKSFKLFVADQTFAYSKEAFTAIKEIVSTFSLLPVMEN